jgi:hypothetical protein
MMCGFCGSAGLSGCSGERVHMQSEGEERNAHTDVFLCLMQYGTRGKCPLFTCKNFFLTLLKYRFVLMSDINKIDK